MLKWSLRIAVRTVQVGEIWIVQEQACRNHPKPARKYPASGLSRGMHVLDVRAVGVLALDSDRSFSNHVQSLGRSVVR
jgi:hypothetical protein